MKKLLVVAVDKKSSLKSKLEIFIKQKMKAFFMENKLCSIRILRYNNIH